MAYCAPAQSQMVIGESIQNGIYYDTNFCVCGRGEVGSVECMIGNRGQCDIYLTIAMGYCLLLGIFQA